MCLFPKKTDGIFIHFQPSGKISTCCTLHHFPGAKVQEVQNHIPTEEVAPGHSRFAPNRSISRPRLEEKIWNENWEFAHSISQHEWKELICSRFRWVVFSQDTCPGIHLAFGHNLIASKKVLTMNSFAAQSPMVSITTTCKLCQSITSMWESRSIPFPHHSSHPPRSKPPILIGVAWSEARWVA